MTEQRDDPLMDPSALGWEEETDQQTGLASDWPAGGQPELPAADSRASYRVSLPAFEGPLDLLLHLIRVNQINIYDIPIAEVARQYQEYLDLMRDLSLEVAGDYLVMASTLVYIKSKMMLPALPGAREEAEDPRLELRDRLLEYQRFKEAACSLAERDAEACRVWGVGAPPPGAAEGDILVEATLFDLLAAFQKVLRSIGEDVRLEFRRDTLRVADAMARILELLSLTPSLLFDELLRRRGGRGERIVAFLALLELMRLSAVQAHQTRGGGSILLWRRAPLLLAAAEKRPRRRARRAPPA